MRPGENIVAAMNALDEARVPDDLRPTAFAKVFDLLAKSNGEVGGRADPIGEKPRALDQRTSMDDLLGRVSERLGIDRSVVSEIYEQAETDIEVVVTPRRLD